MSSVHSAVCMDAKMRLREKGRGEGREIWKVAGRIGWGAKCSSAAALKWPENLRTACPPHVNAMQPTLCY